MDRIHASKVDEERKIWESDDIWELRKAFILAHCDDFPRIQLQCLSNLFINVTLTGCEYNEATMEKIKMLGAGIKAPKRKGQFIKASEAKKSRPAAVSDLVILDNADDNKPVMPIVKPVQQQNHEPAPAISEEKLNDLRIYLSQTSTDSSSEQMLQSATERCGLRLRTNRLNKAGTDVQITIQDLVVFRHKFHDGFQEARNSALTSLVETFMSVHATVSGKEIVFGETTPDYVYKNSLNRRLAKLKGLSKENSTLKGLTKSFESVNVTLKQNLTHLQGWSQKVDLVADDVLIATRTLTKDECARPKMMQIVDKMCQEIGDAISKGATITEPNDDVEASLVLSSLQI